MSTYTPYPSLTPHSPAGVAGLRAGLQRLVAAMRSRAELRRQMIALDRLDDHLRADIGLPPKYDGAFRWSADFGGSLR